MSRFHDVPAKILYAVVVTLMSVMCPVPVILLGVIPELLGLLGE
jgi:hypothetical protein